MCALPFIFRLSLINHFANYVSFSSSCKRGHYYVIPFVYPALCKINQSIQFNSILAWGYFTLVYIILVGYFDLPA